MADLKSTLVNGKITVNGQIKSNVASGTPPLVVTSNTVVPNLNADLLDGKEASAFALASAINNVGNFKAVSTAAGQGLTDTEKSNARTNIGAGTSSFSGNYNDLSNKPTIPTIPASLPANGGNADTVDNKHATDFELAFTKNTAFNKNFGITAGTVTEGNDARLSDARTPKTHTHTKSQITDFYEAIMSKTFTNVWATSNTDHTLTTNGSTASADYMIYFGKIYPTGIDFTSSTTINNTYTAGWHIKFRVWADVPTQASYHSYYEWELFGAGTTITYKNFNNNYSACLTYYHMLNKLTAAGLKDLNKLPLMWGINFYSTNSSNSNNANYKRIYKIDVAEMDGCTFEFLDDWKSMRQYHAENTTTMTATNYSGVVSGSSASGTTSFSAVSNGLQETGDNDNAYSQYYYTVLKAGGIGIKGYSIIGQLVDGNWASFTTTSESSSASVIKQFNTTDTFLLGSRILYETSNTVINSNGTTAVNTVYSTYHSLDVRKLSNYYATGTANSFGEFGYSKGWIKVVPNFEDGTFTVDSLLLNDHDRDLLGEGYYYLIGSSYNTTTEKYRISGYINPALYYITADGELQSATNNFVPAERTINNKSLTTDISLTLDDIPDGDNRFLNPNPVSSNHTHMVTPAGSVSSTFTGKGKAPTGSFTGTAATITSTYTPVGSVSSSFTGTAATLTGAFTGTKATIKPSFTPAGNVLSSFTGTAATLTGSFTGTEATISSSYTPTGTVASSFTGSAGSGSTKYTPAGTIEMDNYTPVGTISSVVKSVTAATSTVYSITGVGSTPSLSHTYNSTSQTVTIVFSAGSVPTRSSATVVTRITPTTGAPTFTGTAKAPTGSFTGTEATISIGFTPTGSVSSTFTGKAGTASASYTPAGSVKMNSYTPSGTVSSSFTGTTETGTVDYTPAGTITMGSYTPAGNVSSKFTGTQKTASATYTPAGSISISSYTPEGTVASTFTGSSVSTSTPE